MIDVFDLALRVFLMEGKTLVKTQTTFGLYILLGTNAVMLVSVDTVKGVAHQLMGSDRFHDGHPRRLERTQRPTQPA